MITSNAKIDRAARARRGNATFVSLVAVTVLGGMAAGILALTTASHEETVATMAEVRAELAAAAGVAEAMRELTAVTTEPVTDVTADVAAEEQDPATSGWNDSFGSFFCEWQDATSGGVQDDRPPRRMRDDVDMQSHSMGSSSQPMGLEGSNYWAEITAVGDNVFTITSTGRSGGVTRRVEAVVRQATSEVYDNALFAGNSSGDPNYVLELGGSGAQADDISGDVYSGGGIDLDGDASVAGTMRATGVITPGGGVEGITQQIPDLVSMDYATIADFDVAAQFNSGDAFESRGSAGGAAWMLPEENPCHIFRKNPSDRTSNTSSTTKDDFFLEDAYEPMAYDSSSDGSDPYPITLSGHGGEAGEDGNDKIYYIDGNLWIHNYSTMSLAFHAPSGAPSGTKVTFVVKGNIYFSDNLYLQDPSTDGVAFIALKDDTVTDSGNIYFGDPSFGTLEYMAAFMYAENNFYDNNLNSSGSAEVTVYGNMTAGNQVLINRDYGNQHSKLTVDFDTRISNGELELPGLPDGGVQQAVYEMMSWRELPVD